MGKKRKDVDDNYQDDLWPVDLDAADIQMPIEILRQQASFLQQRTDYSLRAEVDTQQARAVIDGETVDALVHRFVVIAPLLGDYRFELLRVAHGLTGYPCKVSQGKNASLDVDDDTSFRGALQKIFGSNEVKNVVSSLLAQSRR